MTERPLEKQGIFWFYGSAAAAYGIKNNAFSYLLLIYANQVLGLPGRTAAFALFLAMLWDAVSDLILGHWSDKTRSRLGRRHPFMYVSLIMQPLCFYALFNPVIALDESNTFTYVLVMAILIRTATTLFEVPSTALLPDLETNYDRRNKWLAIRHAFGWYGGNGIHFVNFKWWVGVYGVGAAAGYEIYGVVGACLIFLSVLVSSVGPQKAAAKMAPPQEAMNWGEVGKELSQIFESVKNRNFAALFFYGLIVGIAGGLGTALYLYNTTYFFAFSGEQIAVTALYVFASPFIAYFLAPFFGGRFGKKKAAILAILINVCLYPIPYILLLSGYWPPLGSWLSLHIYSVFILVEVVCGIIGGVLLDSMMADVVEDSQLKTERRSEGLFYAARGFAAKAISAGGIVGAGTVVTMVGLDGISGVEAVTYEIRWDLATFFLPLYCTLYFIGLIAVSMYRIDRDQHTANVDALADRGALPNARAD